jgi:hypothetical protein
MNEQINPYVPPKAELADFTDSDALATRPAVVNIALFLIGVDILLTVTRTISGFRRMDAGMDFLWLLLIEAGDVAITIWLGVFIARGRNWARISMLVLWLLGLAIFVFGTYTMYRALPGTAAYLRSWPTLAYALAPHVVMLTVSVLLFGPGRGWFRRRAT